MSEYSISPAGEKFPIPQQEEYAGELERVRALAENARNEGKEVVVVMGVGFVGAVMAAIVADDKIKRYFELGCEVKGMGRGHIQRIKEEMRKTS